jgi:hypothetical protein
MIKRQLARWRARRASRVASQDSTPLILDRKAGEQARFCFAGEFGYELISWIPYLNYLATTRGLSIKTASRPGSALFYKFSKDHQELTTEDIGNMWGSPKTYRSLAVRFPGELIVHPGPDMINRRRICVDGTEWEVKNIHAKLDARNYLMPDLSTIRAPLPFSTGRKIVVINNKYFLQWSDQFKAPVNFFSRADLLELRGLFRRHGYFVVYNHFVEKTSHDEFWQLDDEGIFGEDGESFDLRTSYRQITSPGERNELQISLYNAAEFVLGPQGGNLYLPAFVHRPLYIVMQAGIYLDYLELGRLGQMPVEVFYACRHLINWLETKVLNQQ